MIYSDMQTKHFYALKSTDHVVVKTLENSNKIRVSGFNSDSWDSINNKPKTNSNGNEVEAMFTTDIIDRNLIKRAAVKEIKPIKYKKWVVKSLTSTPTAGTTYYIYFYLEDLMGYGIQDRWDVVASYTATSSDSAYTTMSHLRDALANAISAVGTDGARLKTSPIHGDFIVEIQSDGSQSSTYGDITVKENPDSETYRYDNIDVLTHGNYNVYNVTMSTYDGEKVWGGDVNKEIKAVDDSSDRVSSAMLTYDMESYFVRNRSELYGLTPDFASSVRHETNTDLNATSYYAIDIDYAFSDTQGFTYHSDKQLTIAVPADSSSPYDATAKSIMNSIVGNTVDSLAAIVNDSTIGNQALKDAIAAI